MVNHRVTFTPSLSPYIRCALFQLCEWYLCIRTGCPHPTLGFQSLVTYYGVFVPVNNNLQSIFLGLTNTLTK